MDFVSIASVHNGHNIKECVLGSPGRKIWRKNVVTGVTVWTHMSSFIASGP